MSIFGQVLKATVGLCADGLEYVITKSTHGIVNKYGENEFVQSASEIGSSTVRVTESTVKTLTDVVDGGIDAGVGYLAKDEVKVNNGLERSKIAGKGLVVGVEKGLVYTFQAGRKTTTSAVKAGKYYIKGDKNLACQELGKTKAYAKKFGKVVVVGLLAFGPIDNGDKDTIDE
ncbi:MAG: hypothetical protein PHZ03_06525 [Syntrophomonas sp.]|nr:hypothetical protein [Syntrophomonas sp.]